MTIMNTRFQFLSLIKPKFHTGDLRKVNKNIKHFNHKVTQGAVTVMLKATAYDPSISCEHSSALAALLPIQLRANKPRKAAADDPSAKTAAPT